MISKVRSFIVTRQIVVLSSLALAAGMLAQGQVGTGKIAVISMQGAIVNTKEGQKAAAELESKASPKRKELESRQNEIKSLQDQLQKGQNTLSEATKLELQRNIEIKSKQLQREVDDANADFDQEQQKILQQLVAKVQVVIEKYARDNGITLVVDVSSPQAPFAYASPTIDITKEIIELYDKNSAPAAPAAAPKPTTPPAQKPATPPAAKQPAPGKPPGQ
jgi:outer membrane protein